LEATAFFIAKSRKSLIATLGHNTISWVHRFAVTSRILAYIFQTHQWLEKKVDHRVEKATADLQKY
jgi:hypothetical protein